MRLLTLFLSLLLVVPMGSSMAAADGSAARADTIAVAVSDQPATTLDAATLAAWPRTKVSAATHDEPASVWEGVALLELLRQRGAPVDKALRGAALASFVRVTASDGYQVVFGLGELDAAFGKAAVILVDTRDGKPLGAKDGPFRLVVPGDQRAGRWLRNVVRIEIVSARTTPVKADASH